jgi:hypothetical protein
MHIGRGGSGDDIGAPSRAPAPLQIFKKLVNLNATKREIGYAHEIFSQKL